jgi:hypothetical protein
MSFTFLALNFTNWLHAMWCSNTECGVLATGNYGCCYSGFRQHIKHLIQAQESKSLKFHMFSLFAVFSPSDFVNKSLKKAALIFEDPLHTNSEDQTLILMPGEINTLIYVTSSHWPNYNIILVQFISPCFLYMIHKTKKCTVLYSPRRNVGFFLHTEGDKLSENSIQNLWIKKAVTVFAKLVGYTLFRSLKCAKWLVSLQPQNFA